MAWNPTERLHRLPALTGCSFTCLHYFSEFHYKPTTYTRNEIFLAAVKYAFLSNQLYIFSQIFKIDKSFEFNLITEQQRCLQCLNVFGCQRVLRTLSRTDMRDATSSNFVLNAPNSQPKGSVQHNWLKWHFSFLDSDPPAPAPCEAPVCVMLVTPLTTEFGWSLEPACRVQVSHIWKSRQQYCVVGFNIFLSYQIRNVTYINKKKIKAAILFIKPRTILLTKLQTLSILWQVLLQKVYLLSGLSQ